MRANVSSVWPVCIDLSMGGTAQVDSLLLAVITVEAEHACLRECVSECVTVSVSQQEATDDHYLLDENTATSAFSFNHTRTWHDERRERRAG